MGTVYRATRLTDGTEVALKVVRTELVDNPLYRRRFIQEARAASGAQHPNLVNIVDVGEVDGRQFLVMPYLPGGTLQDRLEAGGPLPADEFVRIALELGGALTALHEQGVVHRDVKPSNVILSELDGRAALSDFGLARGEDYSRLTRAGALVGTLDYLAPERIRGDDATPASDLYSLGCVLVECLSGEPPFGRRGPLQVGMAHLGEQPPDPLAERAEMPRELSAAVLSALEKDPADRPLPATAYAKRVQHACASPAPT